VYFGTLGNAVHARWLDNSAKWDRVMGTQITSSIAYDYAVSPDDNIYFGALDQNVYCLDPADGTNRWIHSGISIGDSVESSPAILNNPVTTFDEVYVGANDSKLYVFNGPDGTYLRQFTADGAVKTSPWITPDGKILFGTANGKFYSLNAADLSLNSGWTTNPVTVGGAVYSAPWVDTESTPDYVYFGSQDGKLYALSVEDGTTRSGFPLDVGSPIDSAPLVANGFLYFGADDGKFYAVQTATGQIVPGWPYDTGGPVKSGVAQHFVDIDNIFVLVGSDAGKIYSFRLVK